MWRWYQQHKAQQISSPVDTASKTILREGLVVPTDQGLGATALTQTYSVSGGGGGTITGPKAYSDTFNLKVGPNTYEIPFLSKTP